MRPWRALIALAATFALISGCSSPGGEEQFEIPFEKYTLDNGLEVILHQDHSDPIVAISILVHVGSSREKPGKTGFAHFFEHMSFNDSENVPRGANRKMIEELGGTRNGGTWTDGTIYYEVVPRDAFEKLMWIDSDRMGYMINTVTEWALENEKQVVKNEKRQRVDNQPYGYTRQVILDHLYPEGHPYNWATIGSLEDLQAATLADVREFYDRYYGPNNATMVIAGDIDVEETKRLVELWFGEIEKGPEVPPMSPMPVKLDGVKSLYHVDAFAKLPEIRLTFPTVEEYHPDSYALAALGAILSEGKRAPLYRVIVEEEKLAPSAGAYNSTSELAGTFTIRVRAKEGVPLDEVKTAIDRALAEFEKDGFLDRDLERIKIEQETQFYRSISSVLGRAFQLAQYNEFTGDPGFVTQEVERLKAVTKQDVVDVYSRYIKDKPYVMTGFVPQGGEKLIVSGATPAEIVEEQIVQGAEETVEADPDFEFERTVTKHERSEPPLGSSPLLTLPEIWTGELDNGMRVLGIEHDELPLIRFTIRMRGGQLVDAPDKAGVASLMAEVMSEGTRNRTPEELEDAIGALGADISIYSGREELTLSATTLARNYEEVLALAEEVLLEPRWDAAEFDRLKSSLLTRIKQREGDPVSLASMTFSKLIYGEDHIFSLPVSGTSETVSGITLDDLKSYYGAHVSPSVATFHVTGDITRDEVVGSLSGMGKRWEARPVEFPGYTMAEPADSPVVYFVDVPGAKQSVIYVGTLALSGSDPDFNKLSFANNRLGAGSSSRLFQLLRIEKGYTYGAGSRISRRNEVAPFVARSSVRANVTLESLELFREQLRNYADTFTEDDLETTKNLLVKQATQNFETLDDLLGVLHEISSLELPLDYVEREQREIMALDLEAVRALIRERIDESRMIYVVVGDAATQLARIEKLGYGKPVQLDIHGNPVS